MKSINYGVLIPILLYFIVVFGVGFYSMKFVLVIWGLSF